MSKKKVIDDDDNVARYDDDGGRAGSGSDSDVEKQRKKVFFLFFYKGCTVQCTMYIFLKIFSCFRAFFAKLVKNYFRVKTTKGGVTYQMIGGILKDIWP